MHEFQERPPIATSPVSVLLPVFNQAANLVAIVEAWVQQFNILQKEYELLLIDDASTDQSAILGQALTSRHPHVRFFHHETRRGFGGCLRTGLEAAGHPLLCYTPCDYQYQPADLKRFLKWIDRVDLVAGYRTIRSRAYRLSWKEYISRWVIRRMFGMHLRDLGCLFVLARRSIFARLPIQSPGLFSHVEILAKANFMSCFMTEVPVALPPPTKETPNPWALDKGQYWRQARHVFFHAHFGLPVIDSDGFTPSTPLETNIEPGTKSIIDT
ncbi:MAG TPA: glycosyltransferase family 2 protein [Gemmataceae bacterium]|jgi:glycosyltransferase involved in cell wall biosynthesis|nr:glycosyltransferase family 2 protein [Gemmataceae bacterium]